MCLRSSFLFYVDIVGGTRIVRCRLDGRQCGSWLHDSIANELTRSSPLHVILATHTLVWSDARGAQLAHVNGTNRHSLSIQPNADLVIGSIDRPLLMSSESATLKQWYVQ